MELGTETRIADRIRLRLRAAAAEVSCSEMAMCVKPNGEQFSFACAGTIKIEDWIKAHPEDGGFPL